MNQRTLAILAALFLANPAWAGWAIQWIDRFDGDGVNWDNWTAQTEANYNNEVQCYTDDDFSPVRNYDVSDGTLQIIARKGTVNCVGQGGQTRTWTSGRLNSKDKREFLYGRIEARLRMYDLDPGTWPAFWMLENRIREQPIAGDGDNVGWPNPGASEIDVWEWFSNGPDEYIMNFFNNFGTACGRKVTHPYDNGAVDVLEWHVYAMEWSPDRADFFMDDRMVASIDLSDCPVYEEPMFVLINLAMGGNLGGIIDPDLEIATYEIDYVAHCQQAPGTTAETCGESTPRPFEVSLDADGQWVNADPDYAANAQGLTFDYMAFADLLFVAWFTWIEAEADEPGGVGTVGAADNRWLTAQLTIDGTIASGPIYATTGGRFDATAQAEQETVEVGSMTVEFTDCDGAIVTYSLDDGSLEGGFPIEPLEKAVNASFECTPGGGGT